ncbi:1868_t:CDS:2 [Dentiscutata erythropus]|uniref:1868_t:CDS:1 n=1 Tax=Dentiscutata erythropus TaxID=1348616 RepID=A0A9N9B2E2_9GLOM|nr:1868_t:CDS:2 [Dentiscutata erythropus]
MKYEMNKSKIKVALTRQVEWFRDFGAKEEKSEAAKMLRQLKNIICPTEKLATGLRS